MSLFEFTFIVLILVIVCLFVVKISVKQDNLYETIIYEFYKPIEQEDEKIILLRNREKDLLREKEELEEELKVVEEEKKALEVV